VLTRRDRGPGLRLDLGRALERGRKPRADRGCELLECHESTLASIAALLCPRFDPPHPPGAAANGDGASTRGGPS
jgi:hypothetical protein